MIEKIGAVAYKFMLPSNGKIHLVFHVSLLKEYHGEPPEDLSLVPEPVIVMEIRPEVIVD